MHIIDVHAGDPAMLSPGAVPRTRGEAEVVGFGNPSDVVAAVALLLPMNPLPSVP